MLVLFCYPRGGGGGIHARLRGWAGSVCPEQNHSPNLKCMLIVSYIDDSGPDRSDVWPSMVTHTRNLCSAFNPTKCTHTAVNTHTPWTANDAAPGEQLGVRCLAQGSHLSRGSEGGRECWLFTPPPKIPARPETPTHDLRVTSPTLYPLGHDCPKKRRRSGLVRDEQRSYGFGMTWGSN